MNCISNAFFWYNNFIIHMEDIRLASMCTFLFVPSNIMYEWYVGIWLVEELYDTLLAPCLSWCSKGYFCKRLCRGLVIDIDQLLFLVSLVVQNAYSSSRIFVFEFLILFLRKPSGVVAKNGTIKREWYKVEELLNSGPI